MNISLLGVLGIVK